MIVSVNSEPNRAEFNNLLNDSLSQMNMAAMNPTNRIAELLGRNLEPYVKDVMSELAVGTPFENTIELISGQKFPDIVANKFYGIEVKTTTQNHWKTTGNSVLETTRVDNVERIFMLFAKLASPIEFRCRPYEEVLSEVVVTHSPRYLIDMNLEEGKTIFDKINLAYDDLRKKENPIKPIVEYYKSKLRPGEELWWMDANNESKASNIVIRIWNNLDYSEQAFLKSKSMAYFPELFSNRSDKFNRVAIWLSTRESVVCPNVRDLYTAGGRSDVFFNNIYYKLLPRIITNLLNNFHQIKNILLEIPAEELSEYWEYKTTEETKLQDWVSQVSENAKSIPGIQGLNLTEILK